MKKEVFISHSSIDKKTADMICSALESSGIGCWIAPRDIPYGNDWAGEIADAIEASKLFLFVLSKNSNTSRQCPKEIAVADQAGVPIICINTENVELSAALKYHLSSSHMMFLDTARIDSQLKGLISSVKDRLCPGEEAIEQPQPQPVSNTITLRASKLVTAEAEEKSETRNVDQELRQEFEKRFGKNAPPAEPPTALQEKIKSIDTKRFFDEFEKRIPGKDSGRNTEGAFWLKDYERPTLAMNESREYTAGKHFSIPIMDGIKTLVFRVREGLINSRTETVFCSAEWIEGVMNKEDSAMTFHIDTVPEKGVRLIFLHMDSVKRKVFINNGVLTNDEVLIAKNPEIIPYQKVTGKALCTSNAAYVNFSAVHDAAEDSKQEEMWDADITLTPTILIDAEEWVPVLRDIYYDETEKKQKARLKIVNDRQYLAFDLNLGNTDSASRPMTDLEKGRCYRCGSDGFPKNLNAAVKHLEQDGSAEALYEIALVFGRESEYLDRELYLDYLLRAAEQHCDRAAAELALGVLSGEIREKTVEDCVVLLEDCVSEGSKVAAFVLGFLTEQTDSRKAFESYLLSARESFRPALARLQCPADVANDDDKKQLLYELFTDGRNSALSLYCMGCVCWYGIGIEAQKDFGRSQFEAATAQGDDDAALELIDILDAEGQKKKALKMLEALAEKNVSYNLILSNRYLDGVGCEICEKNDRKALNLLKTLENGTRSTAINNLGWMYLHGRGCEVDYAEAARLFEKAATLGNAAAHWHLGEMYEKGLGVAANRATAMMYYKKASDLGSEKAQIRLSELAAEN